MASMGSQELELIGVSAMPAMNCNQCHASHELVRDRHGPRLARKIPPPSGLFNPCTSPAFGITRPLQ